MSARGGRLVVEALKNIASRAALSASIFGASIVIGVLVAASSISEVSGIVDQHRELVARGADIWKVQTTVPFAVGRCEQLRGVEGIANAGAPVARESVVLPDYAGSTATILEVTPGFLAIIAPGADPRASVVAGSEVARLLGLKPGSTVITRFADGTERSLLIGEVLPSLLRRPEADQMLLHAVVPHGEVRECLVQAEPGARGSVESLLTSQFADEGAISPLLDTQQVGPTPDERLQNRQSLWIPVAAGLAGVLLFVMSQLIRRAEWTLYSVLGVTAARRLLMLAAEWTVVVFLPFSAGSLAVILLSTTSVSDPIVSLQLLGDLVRAESLLILAPLAAHLALYRRDPLAWVRGE